MPGKRGNHVGAEYGLVGARGQTERGTHCTPGEAERGEPKRGAHGRVGRRDVGIPSKAERDDRGTSGEPERGDNRRVAYSGASKHAEHGRAERDKRGKRCGATPGGRGSAKRG